MLKIENIYKTYNLGKANAVRALKGVSITFPDKGMVFIVGKSGCGKTTLLNILGKLDEPDSGILTAGGRAWTETSEADEYRNRFSAFIFQDFNLLSDFTVAENIRLAKSINAEAVSDEEIERQLSYVGLSGYGNRKTNQISGGEQQRVAIARALVKDSSVILADEPTGNLDSKSSKMVFDLLKEIAKTKLVIVISHDLKSAVEYADRMIRLEDGEVIEDVIRKSEKDFESIFVKPDRKQEMLKAWILPDTDLSEKAVNDAVLDANPWVLGDNAASGTSGRRAKLPQSTVNKLALSKVKKHYVKFIVSVLLIVVSLAVAGLSSAFSGFDLGGTNYDGFEHFGDVGTSIQKGKALGGVGYVDREPRKMSEDDVEYLAACEQIDDYDLIYKVWMGALMPNQMDHGFPRTYNHFSSVIETTTKKIETDYGFSMKYGEVPTSAQRDANGYLHIAISDCTASIIASFGAVLGDGSGIKNVAESELIGKAIDFGSETYVIDGIVRTNFDEYVDYAYSIEGEQFDYPMETRLIYATYRGNYYHAIYAAPGFHNVMYSNKYFGEEGVYIQKTHFDERTAELSETVGGATIAWVRSRQATGFLGDDEILLSENLFYEKFGHEMNSSNDDKIYTYKIKLESAGVDIYYEKDYKVVGVIRNTGKNYYKSTVIVMTDGGFEAMTNGNPMIMGIHIKIPESKAGVNALIDYLEAKQYYVTATLSGPIYTVLNTIYVYETVFGLFTILLSIISMLFIADFMVSAIKDRQSEIGILRALGVRGGDVSIIFLIQAALIFVVAAVLATGVLFGLIALLNMILHNTFYGEFENVINLIEILRPTFSAFGLMYVLLLGVLAVSATLPIIKLNRMRPIDCIKRSQ